MPELEAMTKAALGTWLADRLKKDELLAVATTIRDGQFDLGRLRPPAEPLPTPPTPFGGSPVVHTIHFGDTDPREGWASLPADIRRGALQPGWARVTATPNGDIADLVVG